MFKDVVVEMLDWLMVVQHVKVVWSSVPVAHGAQCVMMDGIKWMLVLSVDNLAFLHQVSCCLNMII